MRGDLLALGAMGVLAAAGAVRQGSGARAASEAALEAAQEIRKLLLALPGVHEEYGWEQAISFDFLVMGVTWRAKRLKLSDVGFRNAAVKTLSDALLKAGFELYTTDRLRDQNSTMLRAGDAKVTIHPTNSDELEIELHNPNPVFLLGGDHGPWARAKNEGKLSFWRKQVSKGSRAVAPAATRLAERLKMEIENDPNVDTCKPYLEFDDFDLSGYTDFRDEEGELDSMANRANLLCFNVEWIGESRRDSTRFLLSIVKRAMSKAGLKLVKPDAADLEGHMGDARVLVWENENDLKVVFTRVQEKPLLSGTDAGPWAVAQRAPKKIPKTKAGAGKKRSGSRSVSDAARRMMNSISEAFKADPEYKVSNWDVPSESSIYDTGEPDERVSLHANWFPKGRELDIEEDWQWMRGHAIGNALKKLRKLGFLVEIQDYSYATLKKGNARLNIGLEMHEKMHFILFAPDPIYTLGGDKSVWAQAQAQAKLKGSRARHQGSRAVSQPAREMMNLISATFKADTAYDVRKWVVDSEHGSEVDTRVMLHLEWYPLSLDSHRDAVIPEAVRKLVRLGFQVEETSNNRARLDLHGARVVVERDRWGGLEIWLFDPEPELLLGGDHSLWGQARRLEGGFRAR